jgi:hypothetical protein
MSFLRAGAIATRVPAVTPRIAVVCAAAYCQIRSAGLRIPLDPVGELSALLRRHRGALADKRARLDAMLAANEMQPRDVRNLFEGFRHDDFADEVRERWSDTDAYKESARRARQYGKQEWEAIRSESEPPTSGPPS